MPDAPTRPESISGVIKNKLGTEARCPKCGNELEFSVYMNTDVISVNLVSDERAQRPWMITSPNLGVLKIKDVRCGGCGYRNTPSHFRKESVSTR